MGQSITTKYTGPGNVRGSWIVAKTASGIRKAFPYDCALSSEANHAGAAFALAASLNWTGEWFGAGLDWKGACVWVCPSRADASNRFDVAT